MTVVTGPMRRGWLGQFPPWRRRRIICGARKLAFVYARSLVSVGRCSRFLGAWPGHMAIMHDPTTAYIEQVVLGFVVTSLTDAVE